MKNHLLTQNRYQVHISRFDQNYFCYKNLYYNLKLKNRKLYKYKIILYIYFYIYLQNPQKQNANIIKFLTEIKVSNKGVEGLELAESSFIGSSIDSKPSS